MKIIGGLPNSLGAVPEPYIILKAGDMATATLTSDPMLVYEMILSCIQAVYTGSPVGTLKLQQSVNGTTWTDVASSAVSISAAGDTIWSVTDLAAPLMRAVYTKTSGTGTINIYAFSKGA